MSLKTDGGFTFKLNFSNTIGFRDHVIKTNAIEYHLDTPIEKTSDVPTRRPILIQIVNAVYLVCNKPQ
jgi:hypothetical protein